MRGSEWGWRGATRRTAPIQSARAEKAETVKLLQCAIPQQDWQASQPTTPWTRGQLQRIKPRRSCLEHGLVLVDAVELVRRVVDVQRGRPFADAEEIADLPGGFAFHRPAQGSSSRGVSEGAPGAAGPGVRIRSRRVLGMDREELEVGDEAGGSRQGRAERAGRGRRRGRSAGPRVDGGPSRCRGDSRAGLLFPLVHQALLDVRLAGPR